MSAHVIRGYGVLNSLGCVALIACGGRTLAPPDDGGPQETPGPPATHTAANPVQAPPKPATPPPANIEPPFVPEPEITPVPAQSTIGSETAPSQCPEPNYPPTRWSPAAEWVPYSPIVPTDPLYAGALLRGVRAAIVGTWHGIATTPWTTPYEVDLTFTAGGGYSSRCSDFPECCRAFYYG